MKRTFLLLLILFSLSAAAQTSFGYASSSEILKAMPEYASAQANLDVLQQKCNTELEQAERELNRKYAEFIDGQDGFPAIIRDKRQKELQELLTKSIAFKKAMQQTMDDARREMMEPLRQRILQAATQLCTDRGYAFIIDTDLECLMGINSAQGVDVTAELKAALGIVEE